MSAFCDISSSTLTAACHHSLLQLLPAGFAAKRQTAGIKFTQVGKNQHFRPGVTHCTDSCEIWHGLVASGSPCPCEMTCQSISSRGGYAAPRVENFTFSVKIHSAREPFDRFLQTLEAFMRPTIPQNCFKFDTIRFTGYRVIGEKPCIIYLPKLFCAMCRKKLCIGSNKKLS